MFLKKSIGLAMLLMASYALTAMPVAAQDQVYNTGVGGIIYCQLACPQMPTITCSMIGMTAGYPNDGGTTMLMALIMQDGGYQIVAVCNLTGGWCDPIVGCSITNKPPPSMRKSPSASEILEQARLRSVQ